MVGYVYKTINKKNGKIYIGKCKSTYFKKDYIGSGKLLWEDVNKYGRNKFNTVIIRRCSTLKELNEMEIYYIAYYRKKYGRDRCYNIASGGQGGWGHSDPEPKSFFMMRAVKRMLIVSLVIILIIIGGIILWKR